MVDLEICKGCWIGEKKKDQEIWGIDTFHERAQAKVAGQESKLKEVR